MKFLNLFKKDKSFKKGSSYIVNGGDFEGLILIYIESTEESHGFLSIPDTKNHWIPKEKFDFGLDECIIEFIENVPKYVIKITEIKFRENENI